MNWLRRRQSATLYAALLVVFLTSRVVFFAVTTAGEYRLYQRYDTAARATSLAELYRTTDVEYPHLAVAFGSAAGVLADALPDWTARLVRWRPNKFEYPYTEETDAEHAAGDKYEAALGLVLFAVDAWCLWLVYAIARRVYPTDDTLARVGRLTCYVVCTGMLGLILFDRQDLVVALAALLALWALAAGRPAAGYALLALGTAYKLVPALLLPVWVLAAAAATAGPGATSGRFLRRVAIEGAVAGVILAAWPALTYLCGGGGRGFVFLTFHSQRGLQLEAPAAWPVLLIEPTTEVGHGYGSYNLRGDLADRVARPTRLLMPLAVLLGSLIAARGFWRAARGTGGYRVPSTEYRVPSAEHLMPGEERSVLRTPYSVLRTRYSHLVPHVVAGALLVWLGFIAANKVGSPQYLLWVGPLVPLLPLRTTAEWCWVGLLLVVMLLTTLVYPGRYYLDLIGPLVRDDPPTWRGPTRLGLFLLAARSVTLVGATAWLAVSVWRHPRLEVPSPLPPESNP